MENAVRFSQKAKPLTQQQYLDNVATMRKSGDLDRVARLLSMAYQVFSCANAYTEEANDIMENYGFVVKKLKTASNNLMQSFEVYNKVFSDLVNSCKNPDNALRQMCFDNDILTELLDAFMQNNIDVKRGAFFGATLFLPSK